VQLVPQVLPVLARLASRVLQIQLVQLASPVQLVSLVWLAPLVLLV
jgi:hypothetical protein